ncbi:MAG: cytochrome c oxidase subunit II [Anaerolineales bacterium]
MNDQQSPEKRTLLLEKSLGWGSLLLLLLSGCGVRALDPAGPAAAAIADLWWVMFFTSLVVFIVVMALMIMALRRRERPENKDAFARRLVTFGGVVVPGLIVLGLMVYNTYITVDLEEPPAPSEVVIAVHSYQWWWSVHYPGYDFTTANEIHVPAGQPVTLTLQSDDVIHAFWVPELHGKRDMMPDQEGRIWLQADEPGTYRGQCAEFCGRQHAKMQFLVIAHSPEEFAMWASQQQAAPSTDLDNDLIFRGQQVFLGSECVYCHTVRGTNATGTLGPDLTTLASRQELGAGTLPNTRGHLAAWIIDAQQFKPGNLMPPMPMSGGELQEMLAYLETLR